MRFLVAVGFVPLVACRGPQPSSPTPSNPGVALFEDRCETCHAEADAAEGRPQLVAAQLDPKTANLALKKLLNGSMPPDEHLPDADAKMLADWLCVETRRTSDACAALVHHERRFAPGLPVLLTTVKRKSGREPQPGLYREELEDHMRTSVSNPALDPSIVTLTTGVAFDSCLPPANADGTRPPLTPADETAFHACFQAYLESVTKPIAPPPGGQR